MAIPGLSIIGESINDSVPSTNKMFEANDIAGIIALAKEQDAGGAAYIDVNVGMRTPGFMADIVRKIQEVAAKPLAIDTPDTELAAAGLDAYDPARAGGKKPILNSISLMRLEMFDLYKSQPFIPILLVFEREDNGTSRRNRNAEETYATARKMLQHARKVAGLANGECIFDPGISPIGSDTEGLTKTVLGAARLIHKDPDMAGVHLSVGLSNFTVMLPAKRADGSAVKGPLESAFLTKAIPLGLDMIVGSVKRKYELLPEDHPAMQCLNDVLRLDGYDALMRVMEFYS